MGYPNQDENEPGEGAMEMTECGCADKCLNKPDCVFETPATREIASLRAQLAEEKAKHALTIQHAHWQAAQIMARDALLDHQAQTLKKTDISE